VVVMATLSDDGKPHLVPIVFVARPDRRQLISAVDAKPKASRELRRIRNIRRDPRVTVLAHHYEADWSNLWWVRADARASVIDQRPPSADLLIDKYPDYSDHELGPWIVIDVEALTGWSAAPI
jgi:PPOX class probable F420-dependent enzyme